ncbi:MAG: CHAT domain-containing protein, partial [Bacteroidetes bacterium]|nr:CHAT domain-containing protein [Bacteroidota bacterium]
GNNELIARYDNWLGIKQQLAKLYSLPKAKQYQNTDSLEEQANAIEKELVLKSNEFQKNKELFNLNWLGIKKNLKENEAAIEFLNYRKLENNNTYSNNYCALVILPKSTVIARNEAISPIMVNLFEAKELEAVIGEFAGNNLDYISKIYGTLKSQNNKIYDIIWKPIDSLLTGINTVYYSPSGLLHKIAFSAIITDDNKYLSGKYTLNSLASTNIITEQFDKDILTKNLGLCIFGGAQFSSEKGEQEIWKYLEGTKNEANAINKILSDNKIPTKEFSGLLASEENFKSLDGKNSPAILHIATHGFFYSDPKEIKENKEEKLEVGDVAFRGGGIGIESFVTNTNPLMRSGLALARANDVWSKTKADGEDGVLTAYEVSNMNLQNTQLVVMSA